MTTANKGLDQPAYNSNANTWGTGPLNTNFGLLDSALGASTLLNSTGLGGTTVVLSAAQCVPLSLVVSGTPAGIVTYSVPASIGGQWVVRNGTTGGYAVRVQSAAGGTYVTIIAGDNVQISCDGSASGMVRNDTTAAAGGSTTQVQYNNAGVLAGSANMTFNGTVLTANTLSVTTTVTAGSTVTSSAGGFVFPDSTTQTTAAALPPGMIMQYAAASAPSGWLLCAGQAVSRATYAALFAVAGVTYGAGNGSTTFNVPDFRGRVAAGVDNMNGSAAGRLTGTTMTPNGNTLGATGGTQTHLLVTAEIPAHSHGVTDPGHTHSITQSGNTGSNVFIGGSGGGNSLWSLAAAATATNSNTTGITTTNTGGGGAHLNVQPTLLIYFIIKT